MNDEQINTKENIEDIENNGGREEEKLSTKSPRKLKYLLCNLNFLNLQLFYG